MQEGELFRIETLDWTGGQIGDNDSADDVKNIDLTQVHCLESPSCSLKSEAWSLAPCLCCCNTSSITLPTCRTGSVPVRSAVCAAGALPERATGISELVAIKNGTVSLLFLAATCQRWLRCAPQVHYLSGPVAVKDGSGEPAHPGDILVVSAHTGKRGCVCR